MIGTLKLRLAAFTLRCLANEIISDLEARLVRAATATEARELRVELRRWRAALYAAELT